MAGNPLDDLAQSIAAGVPPRPQAPAGMVGAPSMPSGTGGMLYSALAGGGREALGQLGSAGKGVATLFGADELAKRAGAFASQQQALAAQNENPAWENTSAFSPSGLAYRVLKGLPVAGALAGGAIAAGAMAPEGAAALVGGGVAAGLGYPFALGGGVQSQEGFTGKDVTRGEAAKAAALAVPEAAIGAVPMGRMEGMLATGAKGGMLRAVTGQAGVQALAGAGQDLIAQQMGDPNRPLAQRAQEMVESALTGGATGALFGAAIHHFAKVDPNSFKTPDVGKAVDAALGKEQPAPPPNPDQQLNDAWAQQAGGLPVRDFDRTMEGSEADRLSGAWAVTPQHPGQALLPPPATRLGGEISPRSPDELIATAKELELKGDTEGLLSVIHEMKLRGMLDHVAELPLLPPPDAIRTPQQPLEPAHEPTLAVVPKRDETGVPVSDKKGNPLSTRAPIELGRTITGEPEVPPPVAGLLNAPPPEPTPTGEMGQNRLYQGEVPKMPDRSAPTPETVRQMAEEAAQDANVKRIPKTFTQATTLEDMQAAIRAKWEENGPNKLVRQLAGKFDLLDESGDLKPVAKPEAAPAPAVNPIRDAVDPKHQERFDKLEALRDAVPADHQKAIDDAQVALTNPGRGDVQKAEATIRSLKTVAEGQEAAKALLEKNKVGDARAADLAQQQARAQDAAKPAPAPAQEPTPSAAATALIAKLQAVAKNPAGEPGTRPGDQGVTKGTYGEAKVPPKTQAEAQAQKAAPAATDPVAATLEPLAAMKASETGRNHIDGPVNRAFQRGIVEQKKLLADFDAKAAKNGYVDKDVVLQAPSWDENYGKFSPAAKAAIDAHQNAVEDMITRTRNDLAAKNPGDMFARLGTGDTQPRSQMDVDMTGLVKAGASGKDLLQHVAANGEDPANRVIAAKLAALGVDPETKFAPNWRGEWSAKCGGEYTSGDDVITLRQTSDMERLVLHEMAHAGSVDALERPGAASRQFETLFDEVEKRFRGVDTDSAEYYGLKDRFEFLAEAFSNPQFRDWLRGQKALDGTRPTTLWGKFKDTVSRLLGFDGGAKTLLDQVLEAGNGVLDENAAVRGSADAGAGRYARPSFDPRTPEGQTNSVKDWADTAERARGGLVERLKAAGVAGQKIINGFRGMDAIAEGVKDRIPSAQRIVATVDTRGSQQNVWNKHGSVAAHLYDSLPADQRAMHDSVAAATIGAGVDGRKAWEQQPKELFAAKNSDEIRALWARAHRDWGRMSPEAQAAYQAMVDTTQGHQLAAKAIMFDSAVKAKWEKLTKGFENNPAADFQLDAVSHENPAQAKTFWANELSKRAAGAAEFINAVASRKDPKEMASVERLSSWLRDIKQTEDSQKGVPYFRAGHGSGSFFASADVALDMRGLPDPKAVDKIAARLKANGFGNLVLERSNDNPSMFTRVDSMAKAERLDKIFRDLQAEGALGDKKVASGPVSQARQHGAGPAVLHDMIDTLRSSRPDMPDGTPKEMAARYEDAWNGAISDAVSDFMDMTPDSSPLKMFAHRENVQLFQGEMGQTFRDSVHSASRMLSVLGTARDQGAAVRGVRTELDALKHSDASGPDKANAQDVVNDIMTRLTQAPLSQPNGLIRAAQGITSRMEIGTSVPYFMLLQTQHFTRSLPELGATHGYRNAFGAMTKATAPSWGVMRAMLGDPEWAHAGLRLDTLTKGGVAPELAKFLVRIDNLGGFIQNAYTSAMSPFEEGTGTTTKIANWSSAMGRYAETQPRIQIAIAAKALWRGIEKDGPLDQFVLKKVAGSQQNWGTTSTPRQFTAMGDLGQAGPLMNQFMGYRARFTEKLYGEFHTLFAGETGADKLVAGKWLAGHLAATTVLAGAMGMPMVAVFASVYDKIADSLTGSPTHDIMGSFRHYMESVYGPTVGVAITRGIPAALGVDLSREGDQKIVPGSDMVMLLTEKRKFEDAEKDWLKNMAGSAVGIGANYALGMRDIANGDYLNGAIKMAPEAVRGPLEAVRDTLYGYRDRGGTPIGITPSGVDIALTAMGFDPTQKATYDANKGVLSGLENRRTYQEQNIGQHLAKAVQTNGVGADLPYWMDQSQRYAKDWPGMPPPAADLGRYLELHNRQSAMAQSMGGPMGLQPRNLTALGMVGNLPGR